MNIIYIRRNVAYVTTISVVGKVAYVIIITLSLVEK